MWEVRRVFPNDPAGITMTMYKGVPVETDPWLEPWQRWDTPQYQAIAARGYGAFDTALFTPPLYPLLMGATAGLFGKDSLASGLFISGLASLACLLAIHRAAGYELGDEAAAYRAALFLVIFPTAFFLSAAYSESLFLLGAILSLYSARRQRWLAAGLWGALAALTRITGPLLVVPLAFTAWQACRSREWRAWLAPLITGLGALAFPVYVWLGLGKSPLAILDASTSRGGRLTFPGWNLIEAATRLLHGQLVEENLIELAFTILFIVLTVLIWKKLPRLYGIYAVTLMLFFLIRFGSPQPLVSMGRYVLEVFPAFLLLADWGRRPWVNRLVLYLSVLGLLFFSAQFAIWGWVG
ncbi:MAG TPA: mannosyltransferase family protein [Anaerolineales bacterium]|nr:mannosyltransferase family protein [Anaerolineales bacterium]